MRGRSFDRKILVFKTHRAAAHRAVYEVKVALAVFLNNVCNQVMLETDNRVCNDEMFLLLCSHASSFLERAMGHVKILF